jgi:hypothetical protein
MAQSHNGIILNNTKEAEHWWLAVILATWAAEIRRIAV